MRTFLLVCGLILFLGTTGFADDYVILGPGGFCEKSQAPKNGEQFLGLFPVGKDYELRSVKIHLVESVNDFYMNPDGTDVVGWEVMIDDPIEPLFLLKGPDLKPGPVRTVLSKSTPIALNTPVRLLLSESETYILSASGKLKSKINNTSENSVEKVIDHYTITLHYNIDQDIIQLAECCNHLGEDNALQLLWAGDINGDGRMDFIIDTSENYWGYQPTLFLSTPEKGFIVKKVASHMYVTS
jgi:hypothetical protein